MKIDTRYKCIMRRSRRLWSAPKFPAGPYEYTLAQKAGTKVKRWIVIGGIKRVGSVEAFTVLADYSCESWAKIVADALNETNKSERTRKQK